MKTALEPPLRPPAAVCVDLDERPRVLVVGGGLTLEVGEALVASGLQLHRVPDVLSAIRALASRTYEVVLVSPGIEDEGDGVRLVRTVVRREHVLLHHQAGTPFVILPLPGTREFAVVLGEETQLRDRDLAETVRRLGRR